MSRNAVAVAVASLQTLDSNRPRDIRERALGVIKPLISAESSLFFRYDLRRGECHHASMLSDSETIRQTLIASVDGKPSISSDFWSPFAPRAAAVNRFVPISQSPLPAPDHPVARLLYTPLATRDHTRALIYDGRRFIGWFGFMHSASCVFGRHAFERLKAVTPPLIAALVAADRLERGELDPAPHFVCDANGSIEFATPSGERWINQGERRDLIAKLVRMADRAQTFESHYPIDRADLSVVRLVGSRSAYLLSLAATEAPELSAETVLTSRQRAIVDYAVVGATNNEIAAALNVSVETVRDHMKEIYRRLNVASRLELARALSGDKQP